MQVLKLLKLQRKKVDDETKCEKNGISFGFFYFPAMNRFCV